ncbi:Ig-like domain repeat protein, partial [Streptomyces sp. NPDC049910]
MVDIRIDTSCLSHTRFLLPEHNSGYIDGADAPPLHVEPGQYSYQIASGLLANFHFTVGSDGLLDYPESCDAFVEGRGTKTLTVRGFAITLDGTSLSHDLLPTISGADLLARDQTHELTLLPAVGYGFQPAAGLVGDFRFNVSVDGNVVVDSRYSGFAQAEGRTLTIDGYKLTVDGRKLSHGLLPMNLLGGAAVLTRDQTHELTLLPAVGYGFQPAAGLVGDFRFNVSV